MWGELVAMPCQPGEGRENTPAANRLGQAGARLDAGPLLLQSGCRAGNAVCLGVASRTRPMVRMNGPRNDAIVRGPGGEGVARNVGMVEPFPGLCVSRVPRSGRGTDSWHTRPKPTLTAPVRHFDSGRRTPEFLVQGESWRFPSSSVSMWLKRPRYAPGRIEPTRIHAGLREPVHHRCTHADRVGPLRSSTSASTAIPISLAPQ